MSKFFNESSSQEEDGQKVSSYQSAFIFKKIFSTLQPPDPTDLIEIPPQELRIVKCCSILSKQIYVTPEKRELNNDTGPIVVSSSQSDKFILPYIITNSEVLNTIFVVFRGSYCLDDFIVDLKATSVMVDGGEMHVGIYQTSNNMAEQTLSIIADLSRQSGNRKVIFSGHSLGAAVAAQVAKIARNRFPFINIRAIIFAPAASLSYNLWEESTKYVSSYVLDGDFVPFLSLDNVAHVSHEILPPPLAKILNETLCKQNKASRRSSGTVNINPTPANYNPFEAPPPEIDHIRNSEYA